MKKKISYEPKFFSLKAIPIEKGGKRKMAELFPLQLDPFT